MTIWAEVPAGTVGWIVATGKFVMINELEITKVDRIDGDDIYTVNEQVVFKAHQLRIIDSLS